jgi:hypothetical protein
MRLRRSIYGEALLHRIGLPRPRGSAAGPAFERTGEMTFRVTGKRKYWRLMEMDNPCEGVTDYVDIYFR